MTIRIDAITGVIARYSADRYTLIVHVSDRPEPFTFADRQAVMLALLLTSLGVTITTG